MTGIFQPQNSKQLGKETKTNRSGIISNLHPPFRLSEMAPKIWLNFMKNAARCSPNTRGRTSNMSFVLVFRRPSYSVFRMKSFVISSFLAISRQSSAVVSSSSQLKKKRTFDFSLEFGPQGPSDLITASFVWREILRALIHHEDQHHSLFKHT